MLKEARTNEKFGFPQRDILLEQSKYFLNYFFVLV